MPVERTSDHVLPGPTAHTMRNFTIDYSPVSPALTGTKYTASCRGNRPYALDHSAHPVTANGT